ncbi:MAG: hypothetical protein QNJ54_34810 [Prochloraceae cyanobacterium]|nr:hypothetical protein [Prochloraceae cyanobacterium]
MVTRQKHLNQQTRGQTKKKQRSRNYIDIGTPLKDSQQDILLERSLTFYSSNYGGLAS